MAEEDQRGAREGDGAGGDRRGAERGEGSNDARHGKVDSCVCSEGIRVLEAAQSPRAQSRDELLSGSDAFRPTASRARRQLWSVAGADSARSTVAAQLPRSLSASSEREPGSAA